MERLKGLPFPTNGYAAPAIVNITARLWIAGAVAHRLPDSIEPRATLSVRYTAICQHISIPAAATLDKPALQIGAADNPLLAAFASAEPANGPGLIWAGATDDRKSPEP